MDKLDRMLKEAQRRVPPKPSIDFSYASNDELLELINEATTKERFLEIIYALVERAERGQLWQSD